VTVRQRVAGASPALKFVLMVGIMSFFADFTYEGSRSIAGPYLGMLGAGAFAISVISGTGEFIGYNVRLFSGRGADRTGRHWPITIGGYILQMSVVPLLALSPCRHGAGQQTIHASYKWYHDEAAIPAAPDRSRS